jgi:riboflavin transporter FmnP
VLGNGDYRRANSKFISFDDIRNGEFQLDTFDQKEKSPLSGTLDRKLTRAEKTKRIAVLAMLSAFAIIVATVVRVPVFPAAPFLNIDPKDVFIVIGGFIYGPLAAMMMAPVVALIEMPISGTGPYGAIMNALSSCTFACTAAFIYKRRRTILGAGLGLAAGILVTVPVMLLWNYLIVPLYMFPPGEVAAGRVMIAGMLLPIFLPFNLIKYGLSAAITMILYKPIRIALSKSRLLEITESNQAGSSRKINPGVMIISLFLIITLVMLILSIRGLI